MTTDLQMETDRLFATVRIHIYCHVIYARSRDNGVKTMTDSAEHT